MDICWTFSSTIGLPNKTHVNRWLVMPWIPLLIRPKWWHSRRVSRDCITSIHRRQVILESLDFT